MKGADENESFQSECGAENSAYGKNDNSAAANGRQMERRETLSHHLGSVLTCVCAQTINSAVTLALNWDQMNGFNPVLQFTEHK